MLWVKKVVEGQPAGRVIITSHELEGVGHKWIESMLGATVNQSTISRKWRIVKKEIGSEPLAVFDDGEPFVVVRTLKKKGLGKEGRWEIIAIRYTSVDDVREAYNAQYKLF